MNLEAANLANARAGRWSSAGMFACFALAGGMLIASLAVAESPAKLPVLSQTMTTVR